MLFKVAKFCIRAQNKPIKKHGIDDDEYMGSYKTPFKYVNPHKESVKKRDGNKRIDLYIDLEDIIYE